MTSSTASSVRSNVSMWLLVAVVIVLAVAPLFLNRGSEFGGADGLAEETITEIQPEVRPWFEPLWEPPGGETESLLFSLQAALGAGLIGYYFGLKRGQDRRDTNEKLKGRA